MHKFSHFISFFETEKEKTSPESKREDERLFFLLSHCRQYMPFLCFSRIKKCYDGKYEKKRPSQHQLHGE